MTVSITGDELLRVADIKPDTSVEGSKMHAATLVFGNITTPCIIKPVAHGTVEELERGHRTFSLNIPSRFRRTDHTKKGFVDVQIGTTVIRFSVYIHTDHLERFLGAYMMASVRVALKQ